MYLRMLTLIIFTFLFASHNVNASPVFIKKTASSPHEKPARPIRKSTFIAFKTLSSSDVFPNQFEAKMNNTSKTLALKADFWFAFFAIGSLASMLLIKGNRG